MFRNRRDRPAPASADPVAPVPDPVATPPADPVASILDQYVRSAPSAQNALDIFTGEWTSRFPERCGLNAGHVPLFEDDRIAWVMERLDGVDGFHVLELGPLEGGHSSMLHSAGASVVAVESNTRAFLKCLVAKEVLGLSRCQFLLGDFVPFLEQSDQTYDLLLASGVLYHSPDPLRMLESMARQSPRVAIWTHYFVDEVVAADEVKRRMFVPEIEYRDWRGHRFALHRRNYRESLEWSGFCGGPESSALWMEREDFMVALGDLGYTSIDVKFDDLDHPNGPCVMLLATRETDSAPAPPTSG